MENFFVLIGVYQFFTSLAAGLVGDGRTCGFGWAFLAWFVNPLLGLAVILTAKDKRDIKPVSLGHLGKDAFGT